MNSMVNISIYGSHNAAYAVSVDGAIKEVIEIERLLNYKNSGLAQYKCPKIKDILFWGKFIPKMLHKKYNVAEFDKCFYLNSDIVLDESYSLERYIKAKEYVSVNHHVAHANGVFYQSPYKEAIIFSFDGGGNDGTFNIYHAERNNGCSLLERVLRSDGNDYDIGFPYMAIAHYLDDIRYEELSDGNLVYPGKIMGLCSYGKVIGEWVSAFTDFYKSGISGLNIDEKISDLSAAIGVELTTKKRISGQVAYDLAATSQRVFEDCFLEIAMPYIERYKDLPVCMAGGCAMNIILNTRVYNIKNGNVFVGPNSNDCGIAIGMLLSDIKPTKQCDITYAGIDLLDRDMLPLYMNDSHKTYSGFLDVKEVGDDIISGKIIGTIIGKSEHGQRALGNRSILCNPTIAGMRDKINKEIKKREWYRPFEPVVRLYDVNRYFKFASESRWMCYAVEVREEYRGVLSEITHVDGTARVQTVTREQHGFLFDLLTYIEEMTGVGVLLNTSFNVNGKPLISSLSDAFSILNNTDLDGLIVDDVYIKKG